MAEGIVKWFRDHKGYGFIEQDEGRDILVHYSSINMIGLKTLVIANCELCIAARGLQADRPALETCREPPIIHDLSRGVEQSGSSSGS